MRLRIQLNAFVFGSLLLASESMATDNPYLFVDDQSPMLGRDAYSAARKRW